LAAAHFARFYDLYHGHLLCYLEFLLMKRIYIPSFSATLTATFRRRSRTTGIPDFTINIVFGQLSYSTNLGLEAQLLHQIANNQNAPR
jgi:hypothetical protein